MAADSMTGLTLLGKLRMDPDDQLAWHEFVERYGRKIFRWCRNWDLSATDAEDVTQIVLLRLAEKMRHFVYDPSRSFRAWLKTLTQHAWSDFVESQKRPGRGSGDTQMHDLLHTLEARDDLVKHLDEQFDQELLQEAMNRVQQRVAPQTWDAFRLTALEGLSGAEAAQRLQTKVATIFVQRGRVQKMLQEEVQRMGEEVAPS
jgi:RNA polymerase sigma-70 factor (ECF subfamily)